jgi:hypothetical protein
MISNQKILHSSFNSTISKGLLRKHMHRVVSQHVMCSASGWPCRTDSAARQENFPTDRQRDWEGKLGMQSPASEKYPVSIRTVCGKSSPAAALFCGAAPLAGLADKKHPCCHMAHARWAMQPRLEQSCDRMERFTWSKLSRHNFYKV